MLRLSPYEVTKGPPDPGPGGARPFLVVLEHSTSLQSNTATKSPIGSGKSGESRVLIYVPVLRLPVSAVGRQKGDTLHIMGIDE